MLSSAPKKIFSAVLFVLFCAELASAQIPAQRDSAAVFKPDSLALAVPDSVIADTTREKSDLKAPVDFEAQREDHDLENRITYLYGRAKVKYKTMILEAGKITVEWDKHLLTAEPLPDSLLATNGEAANGKSKSARADSLAKAEKGYPVFADGGERIVGERMEYNFATEKGRVLRGRTAFQDGKYFGAQIKRVDGQTYFVSNGDYSTCDLEENPHFRFRGRKMKVTVGKNVVAKPVVFYIGKIPMAILPFAFFPTNSGGRRSGLIVPRFGASQNEGRYLRGLGYYWAMSDYYDAKVTADYYDRHSDWLLNGEFNYAKRYQFSGNLSGSITQSEFESLGTSARSWDIAVRHNQTFSQTATLNVSGSFASSPNFYRFFSSNRQDQLRRTITSQATFSKSFGGASFSATASEYKNLDTGEFRRLLPSFSLNFGQRQLFGKRDSDQKKPGAKPDERRWYENFYYSFSSSAQNNYSKDSTKAVVKRLSAANHNISLSLNGIKAVFPWLSLNQSMPITADWFDRATEYSIQAGGKVASAVKKGFATRHWFTYFASTNTKLYGTFQPKLGPVRALRHVMTPSVGFSFQPDFSDSRWGYYQHLTFKTARGDSTVRLDRFGGTPRGKSASMNFLLGNLFQMKTGRDDSLRKIDLFTLNFSTSHNFAADSFQQANLSSSLFANPTQNTSINLGASHSFYEYDSKRGRTSRRLLFKSGRSIFKNQYLRLTSFSASANFRFQGRGDAAGSAGRFGGLNDDEEESPEQVPSIVQDRFAPAAYFTDTSVPWQANFSLSITQSRDNPAKPSTTAQLSLDNADITLTKNWRLNMSSRFDLRTKSIVDQRYTITRDLHCWEMRFNWTPSGYSKGFYFYLGIKAPLLKDIKLEKRGGRSSVFGGSSYF